MERSTAVSRIMINRNKIDDLLQEGINLHTAGNFSEAEIRYLAIHTLEPENAIASHLLGEIAFQSGKFQAAEAWFLKAIRSQPEQPIFYVSLGNSKLVAGQLDDAISYYTEALHLKPDMAEAYYGLGLVAQQQGRRAEAISHLKMARVLQPDHTLVQYHLGVLLQEEGNLDAAVLCYQAAIRLKPDFLEAYVNLGSILQDQRLLEDAESCYRAVLQFKPESVVALVNLGNVFSEQGRSDQAITSYTKALSLQPDYIDAHNNLANMLKRQGDFGAAKIHYEQALQINPNSPQAHTNLAHLLKDQGQVQAATQHYLTALQLNPDFYDAHYALANLLKDSGSLAEAKLHYEQALRCRPSDCLRIRVATLLPPVYASLDEMRQYRSDMLNNIQFLLKQELTACDPVADGGNNNFYLVYQGEDDKRLQADIAKLYRKVYQPKFLISPKVSMPKDKIKIGFVSGFFKNHTIGELNRGIIANLARDRFEVHVFSIGLHDDAIANLIRQQADQYHAFPSDNLSLIESAIAQQNLDILFYTDIGMEPVSYFLAFSRLARIQCVTWGHPVTTGIDTIDYYISSINQETEDSDEHYSEQLIRLSSLPMFYYPPKLPDSLKERGSYGLSTLKHVYLCPQSLFKLHPDYDQVIADILRLDPHGEIVLIQGQHQAWADVLFERFHRVMPDVVERIRLLPRQNFADYLNLLAISDVMLDPWHFGGGKTTLDALSIGLPVITQPGKFMRGRATYACYQQMGIHDCIASTREEYVSKAVFLATNKSARDEIAKRILERRHYLCEDLGLVRELEQFFTNVCRAAENNE